MLTQTTIATTVKATRDEASEDIDTHRGHRLSDSTPRNDRRAAPGRLIIVGNGMASHRLCQQLVERGFTDRNAVTVLGEEPRPAYDRVHLTDCMESRLPRDLELSSAQWYADHNIELRTGDPVVAIDRTRKTVRTRGDRHIAYDKLVLATGSSPYVPPIDVTSPRNVFVYRTIEHVEAIRHAAANCHRAAVIGGGLLGLEAARALQQLRLEVHVVELANWLMPQQLTPTNGAALAERIRAAGVFLHLGKRTQSITEQSDGLTLHFERGSQLKADMVVISTGIQPRDELARQCELEVALGKGGVVVNDHLETSDPDILAMGECARHRGQIYGLVGPGYQMADVIAGNLCGEAKGFQNPDLSTRLKLLGIDVGVFGDFLEEGESVSFSAGGCRRQLILRHGRLRGAVVVGDWDETGRLQDAVGQSVRIGKHRAARFRKTGRLWPGQQLQDVANWPDSARVCNCVAVTCGTIRQQIQSGAADVETISERTGAGTVCGSCRPLLAQLVGQKADGRKVVGRRAVLAASSLAFALTLAILLIGPIPYAESFEDGLYSFDQIWRIGWIKQLTGYVLAGTATLGLVLSLRKRFKFMKRLGAFGWYRAFHTIIGALCLLMLVVHTGMRMGANLNFALMCVFLGMNLVGAVTGVVAAMESRSSNGAIIARRWRPILTWIHIILFWPLPVLLAFHIASVYLY